MLAIHSAIGGFSDRWIAYCEKQDIPYKKVNCYDTNIVQKLHDCDALMWHHNHALPQDVLIAKQLLFSLEQAGKVVFPDFNTAWYFDDKLGQKYFFEAFELPAAKTHVFYSKKDAKDWLKTATYPMVFKLRRGAGSRNVRLVKNKNQARAIIKKSFGQGFRQYDAWGGIKENWRKLKLSKARPIDLIKAIAHLWVPITLEKAIGRERGYVYFQEFIPDNDFDIRVIVINKKAFAIKRSVRKNDFRASGSGFIQYEKHHFDDSIILTSFEIAKKIKTQCIAFDYVVKGKEHLILEVSYGFSKYGYDDCPGYWDEKLKWHEGPFNPYGWMVEDVISKITERKNNM
jgi:glutathione synthase/RimK-type ligase-like ATP-grasp enzyme